MTTEIIRTDWFLGTDPPEGTVTFKGKNGGLIGAFSYGHDFPVGKEIEVDLTSLNGDIEFETIFSGNPNKEKKLVKVSDWEYEGYGQITGINPVTIDFGDFELEAGEWVNDNRVIGEFIYWKIERLDIWKLE